MHDLVHLAKCSYHNFYISYAVIELVATYLYLYCYSIAILLLTLTLMMKLHKLIWVKFLLLFLTIQVVVFGWKIMNTGMIFLEDLVAANCFVATMNHKVSS